MEAFQNKTVKTRFRNLVKVWIAFPFVVFLAFADPNCESIYVNILYSLIVIAIELTWLTSLLFRSYLFFDAFFAYKAGYK